MSFLDDIVEWGSSKSPYGIQEEERRKAAALQQGADRVNNKAAGARAGYESGVTGRIVGKADNSENRNIYGPQAARDSGRQDQTIGELGGAYNIAKRAADGRDFNAWAAEARARQQHGDQMGTNYALAASVPMARRAAMQRAAGNQTGAAQATLNNSIMQSNAAYQGGARDRLGDINDARMRAALEARGQSMGAD